jgi:hypothetical protein
MNISTIQLEGKGTGYHLVHVVNWLYNKGLEG